MTIEVVSNTLNNIVNKEIADLINRMEQMQ